MLSQPDLIGASSGQDTLSENFDGTPLPLIGRNADGNTAHLATPPQDFGTSSHLEAFTHPGQWQQVNAKHASGPIQEVSPPQGPAHSSMFYHGSPPATGMYYGYFAPTTAGFLPSPVQASEDFGTYPLVNQGFISPNMPIGSSTPSSAGKMISKAAAKAIDGSYPCPDCDKVFTKFFNLKSHLKTHATDKSFHCEHCPVSFRRSHDLKRHIRSLHTHSKTFSCITCMKKFSRADALRRHVRRPGSTCHL
ncbi:MAG: hypothetical protein SGCHY_003511 [Lobulomycetales sp.]